MYQAVYRCLLVVVACVLMPGSCTDLETFEKRRSGRVDCLRYVFAPQCRGVSAKRSSIQITRINDVVPEPESLDNAEMKSFGSVLRSQDSAKTWQPLEDLLFPSLQNDRRPRDRKHRQARYGDESLQDNLAFP